MPRYSRTRSGETGAGADTKNGTQYPVQAYSEINTHLAIDASGISGALLPLLPWCANAQSQWGTRVAVTCDAEFCL
jgi:hypothetical protein